MEEEQEKVYKEIVVTYRCAHKHELTSAYVFLNSLACIYHNEQQTNENTNPNLQPKDGRTNDNPLQGDFTSNVQVVAGTGKSGGDTGKGYKGVPGTRTGRKKAQVLGNKEVSA